MRPSPFVGARGERERGGMKRIGTDGSIRGRGTMMHPRQSKTHKTVLPAAPRRENKLTNRSRYQQDHLLHDTLIKREEGDDDKMADNVQFP